jgi:hypothetical protein
MAQGARLHRRPNGVSSRVVVIGQVKRPGLNALGQRQEQPERVLLSEGGVER